jgi:hypothetical protein
MTPQWRNGAIRGGYERDEGFKADASGLKPQIENDGRSEHLEDVPAGWGGGIC